MNMNIIKKLDEALNTAEKWVLVFLFSFMIALAFLQVILRQFFSAGLLWGDIFLRHGVLWVGFMGAAIGVSQNKHFAIDILKKSLPQKWKDCTELLIDSFAIVCLALLSSSAFKFFVDDKSSGSVLFMVGSLEVPSFWMNAIIPLGFILLLVHFALKTAQDLILTVTSFSSSPKK